MHNSRIKELAQDLYDSVVTMIDNEPEASLDDAVKIAMAVEQAFLAKVIELFE